MIDFQHPWLLLLWPVLVALTLWFAHTRRALSSTFEKTSATLRALVLLCICLALAGVAWVETHGELAVIYVVDTSLSVTNTQGQPLQSPNDRTQAKDFVLQSAKARQDGDRVGVVVFGESPQVEQFVRDQDPDDVWDAKPEAGGSNLEHALRTAFASFPADVHKRVVLLSDGVETDGDARAQATVARELEIPIDTVELTTTQHESDVFAQSLFAPPTVELSQPFQLRFQLRSSKSAQGRVLLYRDDLLLGELPTTLEPGLNVITIPQKLDRSGRFQFRAVVDAQPDTQPANNEARATVHVDGPPRVLVLEGYIKASAPLRNALQSAGFEVVSGSTEDVPATLEEMAAFDTIILSDIPATDLTRMQMHSLSVYVRDLGRGLVMVGGDQSFGLGGYFKTPVEDVLPVRMTQRAKKTLPTQGMVLAIDRSGSMGGGSIGSPSKMDLAREAAAAVVELLSSRDELGVIGFDGSASWVVPYGDLSDKDETLRRIGTLRAGGGTNIYNALHAAHGGIRGGDAHIKHVILLSDGMDGSSNLPKLVRAMYKDGITVTTVSIGTDSDRHTMQEIARIGHGRSYLTTSANSIPQIFTRETMLSKKSFLIEKDTQPELVDPSPALVGINALPDLGGYVATTAKPSASLVLQSPDGDPILAHWRVGLGKSLAFTSDAKPRWASAWIADPELFQRFWGQAVTWTSQTGTRNNVSLLAHMRGGSLELIVDNMSDTAYTDGARTIATIIDPNGGRREVSLRQIAPGRSQARVSAPSEGTYFVSVVQTLHGEEIGRSTRAVHRAWSPEFAPAHTGRPLLQELASRTQGRVNPQPNAVWKRPDTPISSQRPLWLWVTIAALVFWVVDIAHRRFGGFRLPSRPQTSLTPSAPQPAHVPSKSSPRPSYTPALGQPRTPPTTDKDNPTDPSTPPPQPEEEPKPAFTSRLLDAKKRSRRSD